jgi:hypothetical protein
MMLHSILGDALTLGSQASVALKPVAQAASGAVTGTAATAATAVATATSAVSNTNPLTGTIATATAISGSVLNQITSVPTIPLAQPPAAPSAGIGFHNPLDWGWLTSYPDPAMGQFAWFFLLVMLIVLAASLYFLVIVRPRYRDTNSLNYRVIGKYAPWFLSVSAVGLFFVLLRLPIWPGATDPVTGAATSGSFEFGGQQRIWFYLVFLTLIGLAVWFFRYYPNQYRIDRANWEKRAVRRQYDPTTVKRAGITTTPGGSPTGLKRRPRR